MKVQKVESEFVPLSVTIETKDEFDFILQALKLGWANSMTKEQHDILEAAYKKLLEFQLARG
jgi:hypothetical protein